MSRSLISVTDVWREYSVGLAGNPSIKSMEEQYGADWRKVDNRTESRFFTRRLPLYKKIESLSNERGSDSLKTAISTRYGQFYWKVVPFGLSNSGPAFQKMMNTVLADYIGKFVMVYLDDILVFMNGNEEQHKQHVRMVLRKLDEAKLIINKNKCLFNQKELTFLGYNISEKGILPAPQKIEAVMF
ncbi:hypothetical protein G6F43_013253 [Rhizopus delemar]|nr:hypothetical protein G6F43_013253 [Rhizopus delemar]